MRRTLLTVVASVLILSGVACGVSDTPPTNTPAASGIIVTPRPASPAPSPSASPIASQPSASPGSATPATSPVASPGSSADQAAIERAVDAMVQALRDRSRDQLRDLAGDRLRQHLQDQDLQRLADCVPAGTTIRVVDRVIVVTGTSARVTVTLQIATADGKTETVQRVWEFEKQPDGTWKLTSQPECPFRT